MIKWSLSAETLAFILIIIIAVFSYDRKRLSTRIEKLFNTALIMTAASILLNFACIFSIEHCDKVPRTWNVMINSAYFLVSVTMCTMMAAYFFELILQHVYRKNCRVRSTVGLIVLMTAYTLLLIANLWTGWIFSFDSQGQYQRGILNKSGYVILLAELVMVGLCYKNNRQSVEKRVVKVLRLLPFIVFLLVVLQFLFPELLLNGTMVVFVMVSSLISFRSLEKEAAGLPGIGNRRSFYEELTLRLKGKQRFQVVVVSLKDFGVVNQQFGYNTGNEFLYCISSWMKQLRKEGQVFRFGNVTFALLCPYINDEESDQLFVEIRERFRQVWRIGAIQTNIAGSFGQMKCIDFDAEITNIMEILPFMMQLAKEKEDGIIEYDETIEQMFRERKGMLALLREAIEKRMFEVWYQPVYDCHKQRIVSAEALVRLRNYDGKIVRPDLFIPLAEESGMIADVGRFVWNEVCRFIGEHQDIAPEYISVNFSMQQFRSPKLYQQMEESLHKYHVPYEKMKIEITERDILQDMKYMEQQMKLLTEKGLRFFMDDFGTGYSNFYSVMSLPFEVIKLDKSLLNGLENSSRDRLIIQTLVEMFHNIGMKVIAEGIETEEQKNMVQNMGADYIQGFFYAKPMPEEQLVEFLTHSAKR